MKQSEFYTVIKNDGSFAVDFGFYTVGACGYLQAAVCDFIKKEKLISEQRVNPFSKKFGEMKSENCSFSLNKEGSTVRLLCDNKTTFFHTACKADITVCTVSGGALTAEGCIEIKDRRFEFDNDCTVFKNEYPAECAGLTVRGFFGEAPFGVSGGESNAQILFNGKRYILTPFYETTGARGYGKRIYAASDESVNITLTPLFNDVIEKSAPLSAVHQNRFICRAEGYVMLADKKFEFADAYGIISGTRD